jgi:hypothetical protein
MWLKATTQQTTSAVTQSVIFLDCLLHFFNCAKAVEDYENRAGLIVCVFFLSSDGLSSIQVAILINVRRVTAKLCAQQKGHLHLMENIYQLFP